MQSHTYPTQREVARLVDSARTKCFYSLTRSVARIIKSIGHIGTDGDIYEPLHRNSLQSPRLHAGTLAQIGVIEIMGAMAKKIDTRATLLIAAKQVLRKNGYSALSTRDVADKAGVPLSQIHYHFGSKQGLMLALFEYLNDELLDRQQAMFGNPALKLSEQWKLACTYLDEDLASGYVRVLQELWAAGYSDPQIAKAVRTGILRWQDLLTTTARAAHERFGPFSGLAPEDVAALVAAAFIGCEAFVLLGAETQGVPVRTALRKISELICHLESGQSKR